MRTLFIKMRTSLLAHKRIVVIVAAIIVLVAVLCVSLIVLKGQAKGAIDYCDEEFYNFLSAGDSTESVNNYFKNNFAMVKKARNLSIFLSVEEQRRADAYYEMHENFETSFPLVELENTLVLCDQLDAEIAECRSIYSSEQSLICEMFEKGASFSGNRIQTLLNEQSESEVAVVLLFSKILSCDVQSISLEQDSYYHPGNLLNEILERLHKNGFTNSDIVNIYNVYTKTNAADNLILSSGYEEYTSFLSETPSDLLPYQFHGVDQSSLKDLRTYYSTAELDIYNSSKTEGLRHIVVYDYLVQYISTLKCADMFAFTSEEKEAETADASVQTDDKQQISETADDISSPDDAIDKEYDAELASGYDADGNFYQMVATQINSPTSVDIKIGVIKNDEWLVELDSTHPFIKNNGCIGFGGNYSIAEAIKYEVIDYVGNGCFACSNDCIYNANTQKYAEITVNSIRNDSDHPSDDQYILLKTDESLLRFDTETMTQEVIDVGFEDEYYGLGAPSISNYCDGLFMVRYYGKHQDRNGFYDIFGKKVIDLSEYDFYSYNVVPCFEDGTCTFTVKNPADVEFEVTIDTTGAIVSQKQLS